MKMCWNFLTIFVISSTLSYSLADYYTCSPSITINPPANISNAWFYPNGWNATLPDPGYAAGQNCSWIINVPKGMFASLNVEASTDPQSSLIVTDSVNYSTKITSSDLEPFYLMDPSFTITLQANQVGTFAMRVYWREIPQVFPSSWNVHANSTPLALYAGDFDNSTVIQADTRVSLLATYPSASLDFTPILRATQVYDGPSINSTHLGNLYQVLVSKNKLVSNGTYLTLYSLLPGTFAMGNAVILQDYSNVKQFKSYKATYCLMPDLCPIALDATNGTAAAIHISGPLFVTQLSMPTTNKLSVYANYFTDSNKLADYSYSNSLTNLPQKFRGKFTTFVLDQDQASFYLVYNAIKAGWSPAAQGRRGFFASANFGVMDSKQDFDDQVTATKYSNISYTVNRAAIVGQSALSVTITNKQKPVINNVYTVSNFPGGPVYAFGDSISVSYKSNGGISSGPFISFGFDNSASSQGILVTVVVSIWMAIIL